MADEQNIPLSVLRSYSPHPDKLDLSGLTQEEITHGIKSSKLPDYIRYKQYLTDTNEALAQLAEMIIQFAVNLSLDPDQTLDWARKLQQALPQSEFDSWVATLLDGGPSIFMNTLSELQTTYPNGAAGVALVRETDPAKVYVWNGSTWEDFGNYQGIEIRDGAVSTNKIADKAITLDKTDFIIKTGNSVIIDESTPTESGHLDAFTGVFTPSSQETTIPVTMKANTTYKLVYHATTGKGVEQTFPRMVIVYDMNGNFVERLATPSQVENIVYPVERQIRVNYNLELADGNGVIHDFRLYELNPSLESQPKLDSGIRILTESLVDKSVTLAKIGNDVITERNPSVIDVNTPLYLGYLDFDTGAFTEATSRHYTTGYHELEQGVAYRLDIRYTHADGTVATSPRFIAIYNSDNSFSRGFNNVTGFENFTLVNDEKYVRVNFSYLTTEGGQLEVLRLYPIDEGYLPRLRLNSNITIDANAINGLDGVQSYNQDLNTTSDVSFNSVSTSGQLPTGTLTNPPVGLVSGDVWVDTSDSAEFPILRVKL